MTCAECDRYRDEGAEFCPVCGAELREGCPECGRYLSEGAFYCGACGRRLGASPAAAPGPAGPEASMRRTALIAVPLAMAFLVMELCYLVGGTLTVWNWAAGAKMDVIMLLPGLVTVGTVSGLSVQIAWVLIEASIAASVVALAAHTFRDYTKAVGAPAERIQTTPLYWLCVTFSASMVLSVAISMVEMALGAGISASGDLAVGNDPEALLDYADAAVWEEVIARLIPIGIPMTVAGLLCRRKGSWMYLLGGFGMSKLSVALIVISAAMFGFAHMGGWGIGKVIPAFVTGLLLGYLYTRFGIHVSVLFHFLTDYLAVIAYTDLMLPVSLIILCLLAVGCVCVVLLATRLRNWVPKANDMPDWVPPAEESVLPRRTEEESRVGGRIGGASPRDAGRTRRPTRRTWTR